MKVRIFPRLQTDLKNALGGLVKPYIKMNTLLQIRTNILYNKKDKKNKQDADVFVKHFELIFLVDKPKYAQTNSGEIIRERAVGELRFNVSENNIDALIAQLAKLKDMDESELV